MVEGKYKRTHLYIFMVYAPHAQSYENSYSKRLRDIKGHIKILKKTSGYKGSHQN